MSRAVPPSYALLSDASESLSSVQDVGEVVRAVAGACRRWLGTSFAAVALADHGQHTLRLVSHPALPPRVARRWATSSLSAEHPWAASVRTGQAVEHPDPVSPATASPALREELSASGLQAVTSLPLRGRDALLGALVLGWPEPHASSPEERVALRTLAWHTAHAVRRSTVLQVDHDMARTLQEAMLTALPQPDHLELAARYTPAAQGHRVGGDWYDALLRPDGSTAVVIGDVTGHDTEAAATMGQLRSILRGFTVAFAEPPSRVLQHLDRAMAQLEIDTLASAVLAIVEQDDALRRRGLRRVRWSSAGHVPPLLVTPGGGAELLHTPPELLLGLGGWHRSDHQREVPPGSTLLLYTDGLVERRDRDLSTGLAGLPPAVAPWADLPLHDLLDEVLDGVGPAEPEDDIALLAVRFHPEAPSSPEGPAPG